MRVELERVISAESGRRRGQIAPGSSCGMKGKKRPRRQPRYGSLCRTPPSAESGVAGIVDPLPAPAAAAFLYSAPLSLVVIFLMLHPRVFVRALRFCVVAEAFRSCIVANISASTLPAGHRAPRAFVGLRCNGWEAPIKRRR